MTAQKYFSVASAVLESLCVSSIVAGWSSMNYILTNEGYFGSKCNKTVFNSSKQTNQSELCASQQDSLELVFALSIALGNAVILLGGVILDRFGTQFVRNLSTLLFSISCFAIAFSNSETSWILYPAFTSISTTGIILYISNLQTANLFPNFRGTISNFISGSLAASLVVFTIAKSAYKSDISLKAIFLFMAMLGFPITARTYILMPKKLIPYNMPSDFSFGFKEYFCKQENDTESELLLQENNDIENNESTLIHNNYCSEDLTLKSYLFSSIYVLGAFTSLFQWTRVNAFVEFLNAWLKFLLPFNSHLIKLDISIFGYIQLSAFAIAPLYGLIFDFLYHYFTKHGSMTSMQARLKALSFVYFISILSTITYSVFTLLRNSSIQYDATFSLVVISNTFAPANFSLFLIQCFPMKYFGTLNGVVMFALAVVSGLLYPLFYIGLHNFNGNFFVPNLILFVVACLTLAHPINLFRKSRSP